MPTFLDSIQSALLRARYAPVYTLSAIYVAVGALLRLVLWWFNGRGGEVPARSLLWILPTGICNDLIVALYLTLPLALYGFMLTESAWRSRWNRWLLTAGSIVALSALSFLCVAEFFFFEEFNARFNLVAFDYLMYPTEVIGDIRAEYPVTTVLSLSLIVGVGLYGALRSKLLPQGTPVTTLRLRALPLLLQLTAVGFALAFVATDTLSFSENRIANELAENGISSFSMAARTSELPYPAYYATRNAGTNFRVLTTFLSHAGGRWTRLDQGRLSRHFAADPHGLGKMNVVVVTEEAFGAEFSKLYGSSRDLTPNFDALARRSMWFRNMYASGTRTVRGLEAISTSFPPIPSVSILRRPHNEGIATWGSVMAKQGYATSFIYGGYGYFDNMNYFFANNGFEVLDRTAISRVRFANVWGVSDEDLFDRSLEYFDQQHASGKPFFSIVMTTSNHKPYTFRAGVPGVPTSGGGRAAGVRYADFALGYFLRAAETHPWFDNTLFVVVADHGARVYGRADIPLRTYEIPMMFYAPKHLGAQRVDVLTSQIDIAPTVLGLLGLEYEAPFFGANVLACGQCERIALFSHNHDVAAYESGKLAVLHLGKRTATLAYDRSRDRYERIRPDVDLTNLAVAIYQTAYEQFEAHHYE